MKNSLSFLAPLFFFFLQICSGQNGPDVEHFRRLQPSARCHIIHTLNFDSLDAAAFLSKYQPFLEVAQAEKDKKTVWLLRFEYFKKRGALGLKEDEVFKLLAELEASAVAAGLEVEQVVAQHFAIFEKYNTRRIRHEELYVAALHEFERMEQLGFEKFRDFNLPRLLYHSGKFMLSLEDYEKALFFLLPAERYIERTNKGLQTCIFVLNHIQTCYQQQKNYPKGIEYAQKILEICENCPSSEPNQLKFCRTWQGIASIDIASMLVGMGQFAEGEKFAVAGYELVKAPASGDGVGLQAEYDAAQVLISTKLELGKLDDAAALLRRVDAINPALDTLWRKDYFKHLRFYQSYARFYEMKGDFAAAVRYSKRAQPLQDSLERRNDARKLEKIQQRLEAEKYTEKIQLIEKEKQLQKWLRNAALLILLLVAALAYGGYRRLLHKRRLALAELQAAKNDLESFTQTFREKSELAENLRLEIERLSRSGERSEYLEKLTRSTILTEEDWVGFKQIFEKVHPDFIASKRATHPDLTQAELRYLALEKLGLTTHEMANMLGVSDGAIRQTRLRLRQKIGD